MADTKKEIPFEDALKRLEEIVATLEAGTVSLDNSLELFEEGVALSRHCGKRLQTVEKKVELLVKKGSEIVSEDFAAEDTAN